MPLKVRTTSTLNLLLIALLATVTYLPTLCQPFIEDDYPIIALSRTYGPVAGWTQMGHDSVSRVRASTFVLTHWIEGLFGLRPAAFYAVSLLLHILNCWLIYALGRWQLIGYGVSSWAAAFFAIHEGHQEAVMWYAAANELLLFLFGALSLVFWLMFLEKRRWRWYVVSLLFFLLALLSKESSVILVPLLALPLLLPKPRPGRFLWLLPVILISLGYVILIFATREHYFRFQDRSLVLSAPFWETWLKSFFALLLPWGWLSIIALVIWRRNTRLMSLAMIWISLSFVPYMFVDYVHSIPSRQTYLASMGLALLVGAAAASFKERALGSHRLVVVIVLALMLAHNVSYLWLVKRPQFLERAKPTEQLLSFAGKVDGPIYVRCFPRPPIIGDAAVAVMLGKPAGTLIWNETETQQRNTVATFCYESH